MFFWLVLVIWCTYIVMYVQCTMCNEKFTMYNNSKVYVKKTIVVVERGLPPPPAVGGHVRKCVLNKAFPNASHTLYPG